MPNFTIVQVEKENEDGTVDGTWFQGCCGSTIEEATSRAQFYADKAQQYNSTAKYTVIAGETGWVPPGWLFPSAKPLCPILPQ